MPDALFTRQAVTILPDTKDDLSIIYTEEEESDVESDDGIVVDISAMSPVYLVHQFKIRHSNENDSMKITVGAKTSLATTTVPVYLQIWNKTTGLWETLDSQSSAGADESFYLVGRISSNQSSYYDVVTNSIFGETYDLNEIVIRVYQYN